MRLRQLGSAALVLLLVIPGSASNIPPAPTMSGVPRLVLWAWERPEHLEAIDISTTAVAFLSRTILLRTNDVVVRPRMQLLVVPPSAPLIAVVRIETAPAARLTPQQRARTVTILVDAARAPNLRALQIDFDATTSQRDFYAALLRDLRPRVNVPVSITALASWCMGDRWLQSLPVDEAVPMLFRMGPREREAEAYLRRRGITTPLCSASVGVSTDEPRWRLTTGKRVYVFNPQGWSAATVSHIQDQVLRRQ